MMTHRHGPSTKDLAARAARLLILAAAASIAPAAGAQTGPAATGPDQDEATFAVVKAEDVYVRSSAADSYYPFGRLEKGDVVKVTGEKYGWARVLTVGPAFRDFFGYVRYPQGDATHLRIAPDGRSAVTLRRTDILAPNLNTNYNPSDSWKRIYLLEADRPLTILETIRTDRDVVHKVVLPPAAEGWITTTLLAPATPAQIEAWKAAVEGPAAKDAAANAKDAGGKTGMPVAAEPAAVAQPERPGQVLARDEEAVRPVATEPAASPRRTAQTPEAAAPPAAPPTAPAATATSPTPAQTASPEPATGATTTTPPGATPAPRQRIPSEIETGRPGAAAPRTPGETAPAQGGGAAAPQRARDLPRASRGAQERLDELEAAFERIRGEPMQTAEVLPLRDLYRALAEENADNVAFALYCNTRVEQLEIWADLQQRSAELSKLRRRIELSADEAEAVRLALDSRSEYVAVGRLAASAVYDGTRLPRLFRIQDPETGRTVAYLRPQPDYDLAAMVGQLIGIVGSKALDKTLQLPLVTPRRIDLVTSEQRAG